MTKHTGTNQVKQRLFATKLDIKLLIKNPTPKIVHGAVWSRLNERVEFQHVSPLC